VSAADAMNHEYLISMQPFFAKQQKPLTPVELIDQEFEFEKRRLTIEDLRFEIKREGELAEH
jgi:hypothetical protein